MPEYHDIPQAMKTKVEVLAYYRQKYLPSNDNLAGLSTKELKCVLQRCGIGIKGCLESADFLAAAESHRSRRGKDLGEQQVKNLKMLTYALFRMEAKDTTYEALEVLDMIGVENGDPYQVSLIYLEIYMELYMYDKVLNLIQEFGHHKAISFY